MKDINSFITKRRRMKKTTIIEDDEIPTTGMVGVEEHKEGEDIDSNIATTITKKRNKAHEADRLGPPGQIPKCLLLRIISQ